MVVALLTFILISTLQYSTYSNKIIKYKAGDTIFERTQDVLVQDIDEDTNILLSNHEDIRFLPLKLPNTALHIVDHPCSLFDGNFHTSINSQLNRQTVLLCADNSNKKITLVHQSLDTVIKFKTIDYPLVDQKSYTRIYLGSEDQYLLMQVREDEIHVDMIDTAFVQIDTARRAVARSTKAFDFRSN